MVMVKLWGGQVQRGTYGSVAQLRTATYLYLCSTGVPGLTAQWSGAGMQLNGASALGPWRQRAGISAKPAKPSDTGNRKLPGKNGCASTYQRTPGS